MAAKAPTAGRVEPGQILALEADAAGRRPVQAEHGARHRGLAAAALADQAERLARRQRQADAVDRAHHRRPAGEGEVDQRARLAELDDEIVDRQQWLRGYRRVHAGGSAATRSGYRQAVA